MIGRLLTYHAMDMKFRELKLRRDPECPLCGEQPSIRDLINYEDFCGVTARHDPNDMHQTKSLFRLTRPGRLSIGYR